MLRIDRVDRAQAPRVRVFLSDLDSGSTPVTDREPKSYRLLVDGVPQTTATKLDRAGKLGEPVALTLVFQVSPALREVLNEGVDATKRLVRSVPVGSRVGLVAYADVVVTAVKPGDPKEALRQVDDLRIRDDAAEVNVLDAIRDALEDLSASGLPETRVVVALSDGLTTNLDFRDFTSLGRRAREKGIVVHTIGFAPLEPARLRTLYELSRRAGGTFRQTTSATAVAAAFSALEAELREQAVLHYEAGSFFDGKLHDFQIELSAGQASNIVAVELPKLAVKQQKSAGSALFVILLAGVGLVLMTLGALFVLRWRRPAGASVARLGRLAGASGDEAHLGDFDEEDEEEEEEDQDIVGRGRRSLAGRYSSEDVTSDVVGTADPDAFPRDVAEMRGRLLAVQDPMKIESLFDSRPPQRSVSGRYERPERPEHHERYEYHERSDRSELPAPPDAPVRVGSRPDLVPGATGPTRPPYLGLPLPAESTGPPMQPPYLRGSSPREHPSSLLRQPYADESSRPQTGPLAPNPLAPIDAEPPDDTVEVPAGVSVPRMPLPTPDGGRGGGALDPPGERKRSPSVSAASAIELPDPEEFLQQQQGSPGGRQSRLAGAGMPLQVDAVGVPLAPVPEGAQPGRVVQRSTMVLDTDELGAAVPAWIVSIDDVGRLVSLCDGFVLGSDPDADYPLPRATARCRAVVRIQPEGVTLEVAEGAERWAQPLNDGDRFTLGGRQFVFKMAVRVAPATVGAIRVEVLDGMDRGRSIGLREGVAYSIGSHTSCDLVVRGEGVARRHAAVLRKERSCIVADLGMPAGVRVGDELVGCKVLQPGDELSIGSIRLIFIVEAMR